jgi:hypothetical protein
VNGQKTNAVAPTQTPVVIAFYTTGDTRSASGSSGASVSDAFKLRAQKLATPGYVYGVATASDAKTTIKNLAAGLPIAKVYFVGHGNADVFFFDGAPDGTDNFKSVNSDGVLRNPALVHSPMEPDSPDGSSSMNLINELANRLSPSTGPVEIGFLCCNSGITLAGAVAQALTGHGITSGTVNGYNNDYRTNFVPNKPKEPPPATWWTGPGWYDIIQTDDAKKKEIKRGTINAIPAYDTSSNITP